MVEDLARTVRAIGFHRVGRAAGEGAARAGGGGQGHGGDRNAAGRCVVAKGAAGGAVGRRDATTVGIQAQCAGRSAVAHDVNPRADGVRGAAGGEFVGVLGAGLAVCALPQHRSAGRIGHDQVVVVAGTGQRVAPFERYTACLRSQRGVVVAAKRLELDGRGAIDALDGGRNGVAAGDEVTFKGAGLVVVLVAGVGGRGEVQRSGGGDLVHGLGDRAVLKRAFVEVRDVVNDDVAAGGLEIDDVGGERSDAGESGGVAQ